MSQFIDKLNQSLQAVPQPVGFRTALPISPKPKMLLVASLVKTNIEGLTDYVAGADAGVLPIAKPTSEVNTFKKMSQAVPAIPWGGWLRSDDFGNIEPLAKVGCDFVVFPVTTPLAILQSNDMGKILEVEASLSEGLLKAVDELPVDAVLIDGEKKEGLTWHNIMLFQRFADLSTKPLLVSIPSKVTANELQTLWEVGVNGVIVEIGVGQPVKRISKLRQAIDKLAFPPHRRPGKVKALLPYVSQVRGTVTEEEEEEEEEE